MKDGINSCTFKSDSTLEDQKKKQHKIAFSFLPDVREFTSDSDLLLSGKEPITEKVQNQCHCTSTLSIYDSRQ